jgi:hypothetical protein
MALCRRPGRGPSGGSEHQKRPSPAASIHHFALRVADFDATLARLRQVGVAFETDNTPGDLRMEQVDRIETVRLATLESGGKISVVPRSRAE